MKTTPFQTICPRCGAAYDIDVILPQDRVAWVCYRCLCSNETFFSQLGFEHLAGVPTRDVDSIYKKQRRQ